MDRGCSSDSLRAFVHQLSGIAVIPPKAKQAIKPDFDEHL